MTPVSDIPTTVEFVADVFRAYTEQSLALERRADNLRAEVRGLLHQRRMTLQTMDEVERQLALKDEEWFALRSLLAEAVGLLDRATSGATDPAGQREWHDSFIDFGVRYHATKQKQTEGMPMPDACQGGVSCKCQQREGGSLHPTASAG